MSTVDQVLRVFATPDCPDCQGTGVVMGEVFGDERAWFKNPDKICLCVPKITLEQRT
jgi:hypothetical protein